MATVGEGRDRIQTHGWDCWEPQGMGPRSQLEVTPVWFGGTATAASQPGNCAHRRPHARNPDRRFGEERGAWHVAGDKHEFSTVAGSRRHASGGCELHLFLVRLASPIKSPEYGWAFAVSPD
jgi:hypothetical protein